MVWIGITGGLGSGKSTVAEIFAELGFPVLVADQISRLAVGRGSEGLRAVAQAFGPEFVIDGELDRKKMAAAVFKEAKQLALLESIIHPRIRAMVQEKKGELQAAGHKVAFYDVPLLFEKKMVRDFDAVIVVNASEDLCIRRAVARDGLSVEQVSARMAQQLPLIEKVKLADWVIENHGDLVELRRQVERVRGEIEERFG